MRPWLSVLIPCALLGCASADPARPASPSPLASAGSALPEVPLVGLDGKPVLLKDMLAGRPALVNFWATWCESCVAEVPALVRLDEKVRAGGAVVIGIDVGESPEKAADFAKAHGMVYPQLVDEEMRLTDALGQRNVPVTLVLDRTGKVVYRGGALTPEALAAFRAAIGGS